MTNSRMVRGDLTAPTTPEQCHAALKRQERVIADLRKRLDRAEGGLKVIYTWAANNALTNDHVMGICSKSLGGSYD